MTAERSVLLVTHTGRENAVLAAQLAGTKLLAAGLAVRLPSTDARDLPLDGATVVPAGPGAAEGCELVVVLGGDGTLLRGAELARGSGAALLGVNLGHVGFLAEAEEEDLTAVVDRLVAREYTVEERMTLDAVVLRDGVEIASNWAVNEASVEKVSRERMIEVVVEVDGRPLSRWGCDGVVCATPTGSTAYAFSAGGPVVWPEVEALLLVPLSAHALFARPSWWRRRPCSPSSWAPARATRPCCGATGGGWSSWPWGTGSRCAAGRCRSSWPGCTSAVHRPAGPQVRPARGGVARAALPAVIEELRIQGLGVIDDAVLELAPGLTVVTGETGAGKTMVVTGLGLLLGARADSGAVRTAAGQALVEGRVRVSADSPAGRRAAEAGAELDDDGSLILARSVSPEGRSKAWVGGRSAPVGVLTELAEDLVAVHGQSDQQRLLQPTRQRLAVDRYAGDAVGVPLAAYRTAYQRLDAVRRELDELTAQRREREQESELLRDGLERSRRSGRSPARTPSWRSRPSGWPTPTRCGWPGRLRTPRSSAPTRPRTRTRSGWSWAPGGPWSRRSTSTPRWPRWPSGWARWRRSSPTWRPTSPRTRRPSTPTRPGWPPSRTAGRPWAR